MTHTVVYQGVQGSYSSLAAQNYFGLSTPLEGCATSAEVSNRVRAGAVGILPIENTVAGFVAETVDLLYTQPLHIIGETMLKIEHMLLGQQGASVEAVRHVYSHPRVFEECTRFFSAHPQMEKVAYSDTAAAAQWVATQGADTAAIASKQAADMYGLAILVPHIEDSVKNFTRFLILSAQQQEAPSTDTSFKIALVCTLDNKPGTLYALLGVLAQAQINVTTLESRPVPEVPFSYYFYMELLLPPSTSIQSTLHRIEDKTTSLRLLGSYACTTLP